MLVRIDYSNDSLQASWDEAKVTCETTIGRLAVLPSADDAENLIDEIKAISTPYSLEYDRSVKMYEFGMDRRYWIGLSDQEEESNWVWVDNQGKLGYDFWYPNQPDHIISKNPEHCKTDTKIALDESPITTTSSPKPKGRSMSKSKKKHEANGHRKTAKESQSKNTHSHKNKHKKKTTTVKPKKKNKKTTTRKAPKKKTKKKNIPKKKKHHIKTTHAPETKKPKKKHETKTTTRKTTTTAVPIKIRHKTVTRKSSPRPSTTVKPLKTLRTSTHRSTTSHSTTTTTRRTTPQPSQSTTLLAHFANPETFTVPGEAAIMADMINEMQILPEKNKNELLNFLKDDSDISNASIPSASIKSTISTTTSKPPSHTTIMSPLLISTTTTSPATTTTLIIHQTATPKPIDGIEHVTVPGEDVIMKDLMKEIKGLPDSEKSELEAFLKDKSRKRRYEVSPSTTTTTTTSIFNTTTAKPKGKRKAIVSISLKELLEQRRKHRTL
ncbi:mucin-5AC [Folsomia candida]|uniref:mucin-5AC n=1 Tax=Folsomia candida TaxID=158441 RepID=UPI000B902710|nr:mucin-5AC [Folsomia candida]